MSLTIENEKFTIFGSGYEQTRNDSGDGSKEILVLNYNADYACFNSTGEYCWVSINTGGRGIRKLETTNWTEVNQGNVPTDHWGLYHPTNVPNDLGVIVYSNNLVVFNLTTNEIIKTGTLSNVGTLLSDRDCVYDEDENIIRLVTTNSSSGLTISIDLDDLTTTSVSTVGRSCGFIDFDSIYSQQGPQWFTDYAKVYAHNVNGANEWTVTANASGGSGFPNVAVVGLARGNGYFYLPSYVNGKWVMGEYSGVPNLETPLPNRVFGEFPSKPELIVDSRYYAPYTNGRGLACFNSNLGLYVTDFNTLRRVSTSHKPYAVSNHMAIVNMGLYQTGVVYF